MMCKMMHGEGPKIETPIATPKTLAKFLERVQTNKFQKRPYAGGSGRARGRGMRGNVMGDVS